MTQSRLTSLFGRMAQANLDAIALVPGPNLFYFTGLSFHLSERPVVGLFSRRGGPAIVLPELEAGKPALAPFAMQAFPYSEDEASWQRAFQQAAQSLGLAGANVGVEGRRMRVMDLRFLEAAAPGASFEPAEPVLASLRMIKSSEEAANMRKAAVIAEAALQATLPRIRPGMTEKVLAAELTAEILAAGSNSEVPFTPIVASGPNSALPHAFPTERQLQLGELLVLDWGAAVNGYFSDITRTFALGSVDDELKRVYELVKQANAAGTAAVRPGVTCQQVDRAARQVIVEGGYGQYFIHRTGHGLGLEGHEEPNIREGDALPLAEGMTFTIEPGIYLPGRGGVRIEDDVIVAASGAESFTTLSHDLLVLHPDS